MAGGRDRRPAGGQERPRSGVPRPRGSDLGAAPAPPAAPGQDDSVSRNPYLACLHARRRDRGAGEVGAARRRVGAERPRHAGREETAHGRCRWHVPRAVSGFSVSLKINIVAPAGEPLEIPGSDSARPRRVTASQGAAGAARGMGASRNAGFAADSAYAQDRPARYWTVTISAFWSA